MSAADWREVGICSVNAAAQPRRSSRASFADGLPSEPSGLLERPPKPRPADTRAAQWDAPSPPAAGLGSRFARREPRRDPGRLPGGRLARSGQEGHKTGEEE